MEKQQPGVYVPQLGDEVVYLREGHAKFLTDTSDKRQPPWETLIPAEVRLHARRPLHSRQCGRQCEPVHSADYWGLRRHNRKLISYLTCLQASASDWRMRPAEPCTVTHLEYAISSDGDDYTIAKVVRPPRLEPWQPPCGNLVGSTGYPSW